MAIKKKLCTDNTLEEFMYPLWEYSWDKVLLSDHVSISFKAFMNTFMYFFNTAFLIKTSYVSNNNNNNNNNKKKKKRISMGLIGSRN
jgi:hypothetical protein